jgi:hypothetical protein
MWPYASAVLVVLGKLSARWNLLLMHELAVSQIDAWVEASTVLFLITTVSSLVGTVFIRNFVKTWWR